MALRGDQHLCNEWQSIFEHVQELNPTTVHADLFMLTWLEFKTRYTLDEKQNVWVKKV
jgi:hypothetical protein